MALPQIPSLLLAFLGSAALSLLLLLWWVGVRKRRMEQLRLIRKLSSELAMMQAGNIGLGKKMLALGRQLEAQRQETDLLRAQWAERPVVTHDGVRTEPAPQHQPHLERSAPLAVHTESAFDQAQHLLRAGNAIEQVIRDTGLTRSEAELIQLLSQSEQARAGEAV